MVATAVFKREIYPPAVVAFAWVIGAREVWTGAGGSLVGSVGV